MLPAWVQSGSKSYLYFVNYSDFTHMKQRTAFQPSNRAAGSIPVTRLTSKTLLLVDHPSNGLTDGCLFFIIIAATAVKPVSSYLARINLENPYSSRLSEE